MFSLRSPSKRLGYAVVSSEAFMIAGTICINTAQKISTMRIISLDREFYFSRGDYDLA